MNDKDNRPRSSADFFGPRPPFSAFILPALLWGVVVSLVVTALFAVLIALVGLLQGQTPSLVGIASGGMIWTFFLFLLFGGLRLLSYSRPMQDRAFTVTGFIATFSGLGMLVIFFVGIFEDVAHWFEYIPRMVEKQNKDTLKAREELKDIKAVLERAKASLDAEYQADKAASKEALDEAFKAATDAAVKQLGVEIQKASTAEEEARKAFEPLIEQYQQEVKAALKEYNLVIAKKAKVFQTELEQLVSSYPDFIKKATAASDSPQYLQITLEKRLGKLKQVKAEFDGSGEGYQGFAKFYDAFRGLEAAATMPRDVKEPGIAKAAHRLKDTVVELKNLNEQKAGNSGVYSTEKAYQEALASAPSKKVRERLEAIRKVQVKYDGRDGIFRTAEGLSNAERVAEKDKNVKEAWEVVNKNVFEGYEGFGGVFDTKLADFQKDYLEKKKIADMPLRDTSAWGVLMHFLFQTPSNTPQDAGIWPALLGSLWIALITILFAVPVGVGAALYLEEYKNEGWLGRIIQVNINNLAGVPSVVYSILGAFIFVDLIFRPIAAGESSISPRNVIGGGLTLGLLTLPVVIVSAQEAIKAVPNSIRQGAYALGATHWQVIWRQVLPLARPGILTGTILAVSRAIGEAAPLVLFGALQFVDVTPGLFSGFTVMPMQIYNWAERPYVDVPGEPEKLPVWHYNAALASMILLVMLLLLNGLAIYLRNRAQKTMRV